MKLIDGKEVAASCKARLSAQVKELIDSGKRVPHLVAVLVGENGASQTYVNSKDKSCAEVGFKSTIVRLVEETTQEQLLEVVERLNQDPDVDGVIVQLPLPSHINELDVISAIDHRKDVDGFHPMNTGKMVSGVPSFLPATPKGILQLLEYYNISTSGKHCVVVGRSNIVGRPMSNLLSQKGLDATVTMCHSKTKNIKEIVLSADIIVAALGRPGFITEDMVKEGAVVIDVGITRVEDTTKKSGFRLSGDVDFEKVAPKCSYITPVPGGVGLMTVVALLENTFSAYKKEFYK